MTLIHRITALATALLLAACATPPPPAELDSAVPPLTPIAQIATGPEPVVTLAVARAIASELLEDNLRPGEKIDLDAPDANADLWVRLRSGFKLQDLSDDWVRKAETWYAARPDYVERMTTRGSRYLFHIVD